MKMFYFLASLVTLIAQTNLKAGCIACGCDTKAFERSEVVAEWRVLSNKPFFDADQNIKTRIKLRRIEAFKGNAPKRVTIISEGGTMGNLTSYRSDSLHLKAGKNYVLMMNQDEAGDWHAQPFHAYDASKNRTKLKKFFRGKTLGKRPTLTTANNDDLDTTQYAAVTSSGYSEVSASAISRFSVCDGGQAIRYTIDIDTNELPTGMDEAGAIAAVAESFDAWAAVSSLKFRFVGTETYTTSPNLMSVSDRIIRVQLHDAFNEITASGTLGIGGGSIQGDLTAGGTIDGQSFAERVSGFVVMEDPSVNSLLENANTFKRVLTHEIGHALGLAHSSEIPSETDPYLADATMYYRVSAGSTGATLQNYDIDIIRFGYPENDTPPYSINRVMTAITTSNYSNLSSDLGVNKIKLRSYDLGVSSTTPTLASSTANNGVFSLSGDILTYTPNDNFGDASLTPTQIEQGTFYDRATITFSDGVNEGSAVNIAIVGFANDTTPTDGLPNTWMSANFGTTAAGAPGSNSHPDSDPDGDGLTNRLEFSLGTDPNSASSGPVNFTYDQATRLITFTPERFAPYWIESSSTLDTNSWDTRRIMTHYGAGETSISDFSADETPAKEFYRVVTGL